MTNPVETTAMGNLLTQVRASGELASLTDLRAVIRKSSDVGRFQPNQSAAWQDAGEQFGELRGCIAEMSSTTKGNPSKNFRARRCK